MDENKKKNTLWLCLNPLPGVIAVILSFTISKSVLWCFFHYFCGWLYVMYWLLRYTGVCEYINQFVVR